MKNVIDITERIRGGVAQQNLNNSDPKWPIKQAVFLFAVIALLAAFGLKFIGSPSYEKVMYYVVDSASGINTGPFATEADCKRLADPLQSPCRTGAELSAINSK